MLQLVLGVSRLFQFSLEGSVAEIVQYGPYFITLNIFTASKGSNFYILFAITAAGVVSCGGPNSLPVHHP